MDIQAVRKSVAKIKSSLFRNSNSYAIGMLKSHFRGSGLHFKEHQVYVAGDDVRFIDWKILAKTNNPYIKTFEEERRVEIVVVLDASRSMFSGDNNISKLQAAIELICLLFLLAKETNDTIQVLILSDDIISLDKKNGEEGIVNFIASLENKGLLLNSGLLNLEYQFKKVVSENNKLSRIMRYVGNKREVVIFSDFNDFIEPSLLKRILYNKNVHCFQLIAPIDENNKLPFLMTVDSGVGSLNKHVGYIHMKSKDNLENIFEKKFKRLKVTDRYLEEFIKGML